MSWYVTLRLLLKCTYKHLHDDGKEGGGSATSPGVEDKEWEAKEGNKYAAWLGSTHRRFRRSRCTNARHDGVLTWLLPLPSPKMRFRSAMRA